MSLKVNNAINGIYAVGTVRQNISGEEITFYRKIMRDSTGFVKKVLVLMTSQCVNGWTIDQSYYVKIFLPEVP